VGSPCPRIVNFHFRHCVAFTEGTIRPNQFGGSRARSSYRLSCVGCAWSRRCCDCFRAVAGRIVYLRPANIPSSGKAPLVNVTQHLTFAPANRWPLRWFPQKYEKHLRCNRHSLPPAVAELCLVRPHEAKLKLYSRSKTRMFGTRWSTTCRVMVRVLRSGETMISRVSTILPFSFLVNSIE